MRLPAGCSGSARVDEDKEWIVGGNVVVSVVDIFEEVDIRADRVRVPSS